MKPLRVGLVGVGKMGEAHLRTLSAMEDVELVGAADVDESAAARIRETMPCPFFRDFRKVADLADAVVVATPTVTHAEIGCFFLRRGVHVLVEKPLAADVRGADMLIEAASSTGAFLQVGHIERFNPAVEVAREFIHEPRYIECSRVSPYPARSTDIGVVLDLMIHDLDIVLDLCGSPITYVSAIGVRVLSEHEDIANARLMFANGCMAVMTASRVATKKERIVRIFQKNRYIVIDYHAKRVRMFSRREEIDMETARRHPEKVFDMLIERRDLHVDGGDPLRRELESFIRSIRTGTPPVVGGEQARSAVLVASEIVSQIRRES